MEEYLKKVWCLDCLLTGATVYGLVRYGYLSGDPMYFAAQVAGIALVSKPAASMLTEYTNGMGLTMF